MGAPRDPLLAPDRKSIMFYGPCQFASNVQSLTYACSTVTSQRACRGCGPGTSQASNLDDLKTKLSEHLWDMERKTAELKNRLAGQSPPGVWKVARSVGSTTPRPRGAVKS